MVGNLRTTTEQHPKLMRCLSGHEIPSEIVDVEWKLEGLVSVLILGCLHRSVVRICLVLLSSIVYARIPHDANMKKQETVNRNIHTKVKGISETSSPKMSVSLCL